MRITEMNIQKELQINWKLLMSNILNCSLSLGRDSINENKSLKFKR